MFTDRLQTQRFELKYRVDEATAIALRRFVRPFLVPDDFGANRDIPWYPVHSLYLDTATLSLCHATLNGDRNRFKLRARYYDDAPASPVYLEIKRRVDRCIHKQRALVRRECVAPLLAGAWPTVHHLACPEDDRRARPDARQLAALRTFCDLMRRLRATPRAHVAYEREAWVSPGHNAVRITFDRAIRCEPLTELHLDTAFRAPAPVFPATVILEIKFTDRYPTWVAGMIRAFGLQQRSAAKYVDGLAACGAAPRPVAASASEPTNTAVWPRTESNPLGYFPADLRPLTSVL
ncbi:MAG: polyphosphate polymerase domain-containing protein [Verrucomicrobia bacterium]|nr:polyphosphate polymerase domain-containing protein [Verrucomicrobiota bacterium]